MKGNYAVRARCPICSANVRTFVWNGHRIYETHGPHVFAGDTCKASAWLVEDDELLVQPRPPKAPKPVKATRPKAKPRTPKPRPPVACGTDSGYFRHRRRHEPMCPDCLEAHRLASAAQRAEKRANR